MANLALKKQNFGSHFGALFGSVCKSENGAPAETGTLLRPSGQTQKATKQIGSFEGPPRPPFLVSRRPPQKKVPNTWPNNLQKRLLVRAGNL